VDLDERPARVPERVERARLDQRLDVRLFATWIGTFFRKSWNDSNRPFASRAARIASTTLKPTLRTAPSPNRMSSPTAAK
jgi:hypothetical protein